MSEMTSSERFRRMYEHREADRIPIIDSPWGATIERWQNEGMPKDVNYVDFFGLDHVGWVGGDNSPRYESRVIEENDKYTVRTTSWGVTLRNWKHAASTPEFMDFTVVDRDSWEKAKERMKPDRSRVNWTALKRDYPIWKKQGAWIEGGLWFGFDVTHSWMVGTERLLCALVEDPEWCKDMFSHMLELGISILEMAWDEGYRFDCVSWPDDMGYKHNQFFSLPMYRELVKPFHKRAIDWAHSRGVLARLHSCGDVNPFVPELIDIGLDCLNPIEVKAGMNPTELKKKYGGKLAFHGGINAVLWDRPADIRAEMERVVPVMKKNGGYIFSSDHSVPSSVSLEDFRRIVNLAKSLGAYE